MVNYEKNNGFYFATYREITVAEKTKVDINLNLNNMSLTRNYHSLLAFQEIIKQNNCYF